MVRVGVWVRVRSVFSVCNICVQYGCIISLDGANEYSYSHILPAPDTQIGSGASYQHCIPTVY